MKFEEKLHKNTILFFKFRINFIIPLTSPKSYFIMNLKVYGYCEY